MAGYGTRVLIVEPDEGERVVLSLMLENAGYRVHMVSEEGPALEELKRQRFDVVVSSHHMPQINGCRLALLARLVWPRTPMILLSRENTSVSEAAEHGAAYGSLRKPYDFGELLALMENAVHSTHRHRTQSSQSMLLSL